MDTATAIAINNLFEETLLPLGICVGLPVCIVWLCIKSKINETNRRAEIIKLAIENNTQGDMNDLIAQLNTKSKKGSLKYKLLTRLQIGAVSTAFGFGLLVFALWQDFSGGMNPVELRNYYLWSIIALLAGTAIIILFFISKNMLKQELEAENQSAQKN